MLSPVEGPAAEKEEETIPHKKDFICCQVGTSLEMFRSSDKGSEDA